MQLQQCERRTGGNMKIPSSIKYFSMDQRIKATVSRGYSPELVSSTEQFVLKVKVPKILSCSLSLQTYMQGRIYWGKQQARRDGLLAPLKIHLPFLPPCKMSHPNIRLGILWLQRQLLTTNWATFDLMLDIIIILWLFSSVFKGVVTTLNNCFNIVICLMVFWCYNSLWL